MQLRPSVADIPFDASTFRQLQQQLATGALDRDANRLARAPIPLRPPPRPLAQRPARERTRLTELGEATLREGRVAAVVLNGGMATRFGGGAKGVVPVMEGRPETSFLAIKLADAQRRARALGAHIPVAVMHSFATRDASQRHLEAVNWSDLPRDDRYAFVQALLPRVLPDGTPLAELPEAQSLADDQLYAAPGHGDTLPRLRASGVLAALRDRGVAHLLVSNVDNLGATLDPLLVGAHVEAVEGGAAVTVEVVRRETGDAGGCVANLPDGGPAIIEGFRLPEGTDLSAYPHFNSNTLWFSAEAIDSPLSLQWFAVHKKIPWPGGEQREVVQFEQLVGQVTERVQTAFVEVDRNERFLPIKTREDMHNARTELERHARDVGMVSG